MIAQFVQFKSTLSEPEIRDVATQRLPEFRAIPTLLQKYYLKLDRPGHYGGFYIWDSRQALAEFRESELAKSIPAAYSVASPPEIGVHDILFPLREQALDPTRA